MLAFKATKYLGIDMNQGVLTPTALTRLVDIHLEGGFKDLDAIPDDEHGYITSLNGVYVYRRTIH